MAASLQADTRSPTCDHAEHGMLMRRGLKTLRGKKSIRTIKNSLKYLYDNFFS